jgi:hypothetical protein
MEKLFAEMKSIAFAEYVKDFWQRYLGKPHYEREIMDAGLVKKTTALAATWVDSLQAGTVFVATTASSRRRIEET